MKLVRYGAPGAEQPGLIDADWALRDLSGFVDDIAGEVLLPEGLARLHALDPERLPLVSGTPRFGPCVGGVGKVPCIGLNYVDHAAESGNTVPPEPLLFMKATSALNGPRDPVRIPRGSEKTDYEVELGAVIGRPAKYVSEEDALSHVVGYCVVNDVSERAFQRERSGQFTKGKSCDTFAPIGPWLVTADEIADPQGLHIWLEVNGERRQDATTADMVYGVAHLVSYLSQFMTLHTGDVIATGTPPGVGMGMDPPTYLRGGDEVACGIDGLGEQRLTFIPDD